MSMYCCDDLCPSNEELALRIQDGDPQAAPLLLSQNEGYLTMLAASYCEQFSQDFLVDDLKQEGALALLDASTRFDPSYDIKVKREVLKLAQLMLGLFCCSKTISYQ